MKLGLLSESPADEAALRILLEAVLNTSIETVQPPLRARGWPNVMQVLPAVMHHLQFQTDAFGLVVVVDSDDTSLHEADHADPNKFHPHCRLCQLEMTIRRARKRWAIPEGREPLHTAVGLAVPAVEAWYLCGRDNDVGEAGWLLARERGSPRYTRRDLKWRVYGTVRPPLQLETKRAEEEALRLARDIHALEREFPNGFGGLANAVRRWRGGPRGGPNTRHSTHNIEHRIPEERDRVV
jgi:hypothetical protein